MWIAKKSFLLPIIHTRMYISASKCYEEPLFSSHFDIFTVTFPGTLTVNGTRNIFVRTKNVNKHFLVMENGKKVALGTVIFCLYMNLN